MYNGIGLKTARGSGTNGFVQRNLSYVAPSRMLEFARRRDQEIIEPKIRKQDKSILEHQVKREIELAVLELEDKMKEQGFSQEEIEKRVQQEREMRLSKLREQVEALEKQKEKEEEGKEEELHDYGSEEAKKAWMEAGERKDRFKWEKGYGKHDRNRSGDRSRSRGRSRSGSHHRHHRHHHRHHHKD